MGPVPARSIVFHDSPPSSLCQQRGPAAGMAHRTARNLTAFVTPVRRHAPLNRGVWHLSR